MRIILAATLTAVLGASAAGAPRATTERGRHLATVMGCTSCHGAKLDGHLFEENADFVLAWSSNLSRILPGWTDAQIAATLRTGKRPDGRPVWFMPTFAHRQLSDVDMRALIAWLRSVPPSGELHPEMKPGPQMAEAMKRGFQDSAAQAQRLVNRVPVDLGRATAKGRNLATIACSECHGPDLSGVREPRPGEPPDLVVASAYAPAEFARLLRTGIAQNGKPAGEMAEEARKRLSVLSDDEIASIRAYLVARAAH